MRIWARLGVQYVGELKQTGRIQSFADKQQIINIKEARDIYPSILPTTTPTSKESLLPSFLDKIFHELLGIFFQNIVDFVHELIHIFF